jgi:hypothetical protein
VSSARKCQIDLATRRARAIVHIEGLRELNRRVNKQKADALKLCKAIAAAADEAAMGLIEQLLGEQEVAIGREDVATSPFRANGPVAKLKMMQAEQDRGIEDFPGQLTLFGGEEDR